MSAMSQAEVFANGEGDQWFLRNEKRLSSEPSVTEHRISHSVPRGSSVLEIGCAAGHRLEALRSLIDAESSCGLDPSKAAILEGRRVFPGLNLEVGTADQIPFTGPFELIVLGFFLYLVDRDQLPKIVYSVDSLLRPGGTLAIIDFDPPSPSSRDYVHAEGVRSYKMDYASLFTSFPTYALSAKFPSSHAGDQWSEDPEERLALQILKKRNA
jgi:SAM-dependent methyltransferase